MLWGSARHREAPAVGESSIRALFCGVPCAWLSKPQMGTYPLADVCSTFPSSASKTEMRTHSQTVLLRERRRTKSERGERSGCGAEALGSGQPVTAAGVWHTPRWHGACTRHSTWLGSPALCHQHVHLSTACKEEFPSQQISIRPDWVRVPPMHRSSGSPQASRAALT